MANGTAQMCMGVGFYSLDAGNDLQGFRAESHYSSDPTDGISPEWELIAMRKNERASDGYSMASRYACVVVERTSGPQDKANVWTDAYDSSLHSSLADAKAACSELYQKAEWGLAPFGEISLADNDCGPVMTGSSIFGATSPQSIRGFYEVTSKSSKAGFTAACIEETGISFVGRLNIDFRNTSFPYGKDQYEPLVSMAVIELPKDTPEEASEFACVAFRQADGGHIDVVQVEESYNNTADAISDCSSMAYMGGGSTE